MAGVVNGLYVVQGEANAVVALLRKFRRNISHLPALDDHDPLLRNFADLRDVLNSVSDLSDMNFDTFLSPFLDVIKSESTDGPVTARALSAVEKFINYGLLTPNCIRVAGAVQSIADAVTKAKFVGTADAGIDECVLFQIIQTLRSLLLSSCGRHLGNETVCEMLQCCFRMGLEPTLPELLRMAAESALTDMTRILFTSLGAFEQDIRTCLKELIRFLIALTNPQDRANTPQMILLGLNLLGEAFEVGMDYLRNYEPLLPLIRDDLCRTLLQLLGTNKLPLFTATNRVCFLLFESMRSHLKFQLESYFLKLSAIITNEQPKAINYELKEMALESLVHMWRIPGLVTELYLNYDCGLYCNNLFEDLTKLLLQNAFPLGPLLSTHILSLDALLTVIDTIEHNCANKRAGALALHREVTAFRENRPPVLAPRESGEKRPHELAITIEPIDTNDPASYYPPPPLSQIRQQYKGSMTKLPTIGEVIDIKKQKRLMTEGTDLFNQTPAKGIEFLSEKGMLKNPLDPNDVTNWLRHNPRLDKNKIADYICNRKNTEVLKAFVYSFPFDHSRLDEALRLFLESFRLPGESAEISKIMNHFSEHWFNSNNQPFEHVDSAFTLAYAIIMLNVDQHNPQVRRNQPPMTIECFKRNLAGTNNGKDFDQDMLEQIYAAIKSDEIVMPAEQVGAVRENYLWKVLLRRGATDEGAYLQTPDASCAWYDHDLFSIVWGSATAALSYIFDKSEDETILAKALNGYRKCAAIASHFGMTNVFDNLTIHLCKFSTLMGGGFDDDNSHKIDVGDDNMDSTVAEKSHSSTRNALSSDALAIAFAENKKAQMAAKAMFQLVHDHGDNLREGWKNVLDCLLHLLWANLLPEKLIFVEDFVDASGVVSVRQKPKKKPAQNKNDGGLLSWLGFSSGGGGTSSTDSNGTRRTNANEQELLKLAQTVIADCRPEQLVPDSRYLTSSALTEFVNSLVRVSLSIAPPSDQLSLPQQSIPVEQKLAATNDTELDAPMSSSPLLPAEPIPPPRKTHHKVRRLSATDSDALVFLLELLVSVVLENRDRLAQVWSTAREHLNWLLTHFGRNPEVVERAVVALIRVANRNLFRLTDFTGDEHLQQDAAAISVAGSVDEVLHSLAWLLKLRPPALFLFSRQIAFGLHSLLRTNAANVHRAEHWTMFFSLLESAGAALYPEDDVNQPLIGVGGFLSSGDEAELIEDDEAHGRSAVAGRQKRVQRRSIQSDPAEYAADDGKLQQRSINTMSTNDRGYCSADELLPVQQPGQGQQKCQNPLLALAAHTHGSLHKVDSGSGEWIHVNINKPHPQPEQPQSPISEQESTVSKIMKHPRARVFKRGTIVLAPNISRHDPAAFLKACETLSFLARDAAHITPANFQSFVHCLRVMIEASLDGGKCVPTASSTLASMSGTSTIAENLSSSKASSVGSAAQQQQHHLTLLSTAADHHHDTSGHAKSDASTTADQQERFANCYADASLQLLGICCTLYTKAGAIHQEWAVQHQQREVESGTEPLTTAEVTPSQLWIQCWRPLLQAMARLSCDCRRRVRAQALEALGTAFRLPELNQLQPTDWEDCFAEVLFPLLTKLLANISPMDPIGTEETRIRAIQLTCKILLSHLTTISQLETFQDLVGHVFEVTNAFLENASGCSDLLAEVIQESLKNIVLVCENFGLFASAPAFHQEITDRLTGLLQKHSKQGAI